MQYNTQRTKLKLPEYGRNIQQMINYCRNIENQEQRNECARTIASIMSRLFSQLEQDNMVFNPQIERKLWDSINIIADFDLNIDFPCQVIGKEESMPKPEKVPYGNRNIKIRTYGKIIENMIKAIADMPEGKDKDDLLKLVAYQMKKQLFLHNKEAAEDAIVLRDLEWISQGKLNIDKNKFILRNFAEPGSAEAEPKTSQSKKKKNKFK